MKSWLGVFLAATLAAPSAHAGGLFVPGTGPQAQGRADAFTAKADDPTALAHNPAGFAKAVGTVIYVGANFINLSLDYTRAGSYETTGEGLGYEGEAYPTVSDDASPNLGFAGFQAVPQIAVSTDLGMPTLPVRFGAGVYAPLAFPNREFDPSLTINGVAAPGPQRYDIIDQKAETALFSLAVAYRPLAWLDLGGRASWGISRVNATTSTWGLRNYSEDAERDGVFTIDVKDNFVPAWGLGALVRPSDALEFGLAYASKLSIGATGTGEAVLGSRVDPIDPNAQILPQPDETLVICGAGGEVGALTSCLDFALPQTATIAGRWIWREADGSERGDVELDVRWENWGDEAVSDYVVRVDGVDSTVGKSLSETIIRHGLEDVISVRLGGGYRLPGGSLPLRLRGGVAYDTAAAPTNWQRVDFDGAARTTLGLGGSYDVSRFRIDAGAGVVLEGDREVANDCQPPDGPTVAAAGCSGTDTETPFVNRERPDPLQPLNAQTAAFENPFNAGTYSSGYLVFSLGVSATF